MSDVHTPTLVPAAVAAVPIHAKLNRMQRETQTEATFYPDPLSHEELFTRLHHEEWQLLETLRQKMRFMLSELGSSAYDLIALKDVFFTQREVIPDLPITDMVLATSRLHRVAITLAHTTGTLFRIVFSDDFCDEHFHFTETRMLLRKMNKLQQEVTTLRQTNTTLTERVKVLEQQVSLHTKNISHLENANTGLEHKNASLEDQMALLFEQITDDFVFFHENDLSTVRRALDAYDAQGNVRSLFSSNIDAVQHKLQYFQALLVDIREEYKLIGIDLDDPNSGAARIPYSIRQKLRALDAQVHGLSTKFEGIRDGLQSSIVELGNALADKKKVVTLSVQHLKLYELQNRKIRTARQQLHEFRQSLSGFQRTLWKYLVTGNEIRIRPNGTILQDPELFDQQLNESDDDDEDDDVMRVHDLNATLEKLQDSTVKMVDVLGTAEEHKLFLQTLSKCVPTSRSEGDTDNGNNFAPGMTSSSGPLSTTTRQGPGSNPKRNVLENISRLTELMTSYEGNTRPGVASPTAGSLQPRGPKFMKAIDDVFQDNVTTASPIMDARPGQGTNYRKDRRQSETRSNNPTI
eukprot:PhF_6_TR25669/c0_g1_i1/m.36162